MALVAGWPVLPLAAAVASITEMMPVKRARYLER